MGQAVEEFEKRLQENGLKLTGQRRLVVQKAFSMHRHFTADELLDISRKADRRVSKATVYRTLALLTKYKLLDEHDFGRGSTYYEQMVGYAHHDHLVCLRCGRIIEFQNDAIEKLQDEVVKEHQFLMLTHSLKLFGLCPLCQR